MKLSIEPAASSPIGARVLNVDLAKRPSGETIAAIEAALERHGVLIFPGQKVTPVEQVEFSAAFAELVPTNRLDARHADCPEIFVVGNTGPKLVTFAPREEGGPIEWHADHMHVAKPARASLLYALEVPDYGADTLFSCMYSVFDSFSSEEQAEFSKLKAQHSVAGLNRFLRSHSDPNASEGRYVSGEDLVVSWPLVRHHPVTGRPSLYFGSQVSVGIEGWPVERALPLIDRLAEIASQPEHVYRHRWQAGDAVLWDNRRTLHAGTPFDVTRYRRTMHRTTWLEDRAIV